MAQPPQIAQDADLPRLRESNRFEARREAILQSATREMLRRGLRGMTFAEVAAPLGLVPTGIIYYFKNKSQLAAAVQDRAIERFDQLIDEVAADPATPPVEAFVRAYLDDRARVERGQTPDIVTFNEIPALAEPTVTEAYVRMFRRVRRLLPSRPYDTRAARTGRAVLLLGQIGFTRGWIFNWRPKDYRRIADRMNSILMHGLVNGPGPLPEARSLNLLPAGNDESASQEQFLRAATRLINEEGYHGASVHRISASLNVTKGAFYHHHDNKDGLVVACFERTFQILWRAVDAAEAAGGGGLQVLVSLFSALIDLQLTGAPLLRTSALSTVPLELHGDLLGRLRRITIRLASILSDGVADGSVRPVDASIAAQMLTGAINSASDLSFWPYDEPAETTAANYVNAVFLGLAG